MSFADNGLAPSARMPKTMLEETISMKIGIGGPPPINKKLNNATNKIVPPKTEYARNTFLFDSLLNFSLHNTKINRPTPI